LKEILYSHGEPAGIGVDLILKLANTKYWKEIKIPIVTLADENLLKARAKKLNININFIRLKNIKDAKKNRIGKLQFYCIQHCADPSPGILNPKNADYVISNLNFAIDASMKNPRVGLVTGPIQKSNIIEGGFNSFQGHTEWIKQKTNSETVVMLLASKKLKVALATTHIPLKEVSKTISELKLVEIIKTVDEGLKNKFKLKNPIIKILGLNPHAGESGKIGNEELTIINPAVQKCRKMGIKISDAISADTAFNKVQLENTDTYIAMYHDQALPVFKALSFGKAINITLGVPIIRISVDHGTALDIAGKGTAELGSLKEAMRQVEILLK